MLCVVSKLLDASDHDPTLGSFCVSRAQKVIQRVFKNPMWRVADPPWENAVCYPSGARRGEGSHFPLGRAELREEWDGKANVHESRAARRLGWWHFGRRAAHISRLRWWYNGPTAHSSGSALSRCVGNKVWRNDMNVWDEKKRLSKRSGEGKQKEVLVVSMDRKQLGENILVIGLS